MNKQSGQLLLEILIAVVAVVAIAALGAQLIIVGERSNKFAGERTVALGIVEETFESVRSAATEEWQWIYRPPNGIGDKDLDKGLDKPYHPAIPTDKWTLASGSDAVPINGVDYTRSFYVENVNRDTSTRNIVLTGGVDDPSTQKITVSVTWGNGNSVEASEYFTRWRGKGCAQTDWITSGGGTSTCPSTSYDSATNLSTGTDLMIQ